MKSLFKSHKVITVLEIGASWIKLIQAELLPQAKKIKHIFTRRFEKLTDDEIGKIIAGLSKELKINSNNLVLNVPHKLVVIKNIELPSTNPSEIKDMVELQIGKQTPFSRDEIIYDYRILYTTTEGYSRVMLVIIHKDIIERYFKILDAAGLKTERIRLSSEGLLGWCNFTYKDSILERPYALMDIDYDSSDFEVIVKDKMIFSRSISSGLLQFKANPEDWYKKIIDEINYSIYAYQNEMTDKEIERIIIGGIESLIVGIDKEVLEKKLNLPIEIKHQFTGIPINKDFLNSYNINLQEVSVSSLLGLVLDFDEQKINLIPAHIRMEKSVKEKGRDTYLLGIILVFIFIVVSSIFWGRIYNKERYLAILQQEALTGRVMSIYAIH